MTASAQVASNLETEEWMQSFLHSDVYLHPGARKSAKTLDRSVPDRRQAARGPRVSSNAVLSAPGAEGLSMPRETPVWVSVWGNGSGYVSGFHGAEVKLHVSADDPGEWVPRQWVKAIPD